MKHKQFKYSPILIGYLSLVFMFAFGQVSASSDQTLVSPLGAKSIGTGLGDAALAIEYNAINNEYFVVYTDFDGSCSSNQELRGQIVNALTGDKKGSEIIITSSELPCATHSIVNPKIIYNQEEEEYLILYKSTSALGSKIIYLTIDANSLLTTQGPNLLDEDEIADPFEDLTLGLDESSNIYLIGYHKENALSESSLTIRFVNGSTKGILGYSLSLSKNDFAQTNSGVFNTKLISIDSKVLGSIEVGLSSGSEIHGVFINPQTGELIGDNFQISPSGTAMTNFINPSVAYNSKNDEILVVYEEARAVGADYALNHKIHGQLIDGDEGSSIGPTHQSLTELPSTPYTEDSKLPTVCYSSYSDEFLITFYGIRYAAGSDLYNVYFQRINANDISAINSSSTEIIPMIGTEVVKNKNLRSLPSSFNTTYNQYLVGWNAESTNFVQTQIWRYDNNAPTDLEISSNSFNEELPIGTTIAIISASDPDPEDNSPSFSLVSGTGDDDNSFFEIEGNELKVFKRLSFEDAGTRNIRIQATDSHDKSTESSFAIAINNIDEDPFGLRLAAPLIVEENSDPESFASTISVEDDDVGNTHSYSLIAGDSSDNNVNFEIDQSSGALKLMEPLNYEDTSIQYVRIRATDNTNLSTVKAFAIQVTDINEAPERMEISPDNIPENDIESSMIINVIDPDEYTNYVITEVSGEGDDDNAYFDVSGNELRPQILLDYETRKNYSVRLRAFDGVHDTTQVFQIEVTDVNDAPDSIAISEARVETDLPNGTLIGQLFTYDQDESDSHTYVLQNGTDNFFINGNSVYTLNSLTYDFNNPENNFYAIVVKTTDTQGEIWEESITIEVVLFKDEENPEIRDFDKNPTFIDENETVLNLSISATDNIKVDTVYFYYRSIRSLLDFQQPDSIEIEIQNGTFYVNVPMSANLLDEVGIEYYFKAFDTSGNMDSSGLGHTYWSYNSKDFQAVNKPYDGSAETYKIISNPYLLESNQASKIFADYGASGKNSWRLFSFVNGDNKEIGSNTTSSIERGKGYWFNKTDVLTQQIDFDFARTQQDTKAKPYELNLRKGWNLIGNPYSFDLNWEYVLESNSLSSNEYELYTFNESYKKASILHEFEGGFVFAESAISIVVPLDNQLLPGGRIAKSNESDDGWLVNFSLENNNNKYELAALGMHTSASESYDAYDSPLLPRFINYLDISFSHPEHFSSAFSKDIVDLKENHIWEFVASTNLKNKQVTLSWHSQLPKLHEKQLVIYDVLNDKVINAQSTNSYGISLDQPSPFKAIYGDQSFIEETLNNIKIEALQPYPNPFDYHVAIPMKLPHSPEPYSIECNIYNLMGEKIYERKLKDIAPGVMEIEWNEELTGILDKGIYIYSIKVKNGFLTNKFHGRIVKN